MSKSMTINITQKAIDERVSKNSSKCMIAQAVRLAGGRSTHVTAESVTFNLGNTRYTFPLPAKAAVELLKFEEDKSTVAPFKLKLRNGFERPVITRPHAKKRGPTKKQQRRSTACRTVRRFHGLRVIEVERVANVDR
jgi:hypothetical protein